MLLNSNPHPLPHTIKQIKNVFFHNYSLELNMKFLRFFKHSYVFN